MKGAVEDNKISTEKEKGDYVYLEITKSITNQEFAKVVDKIKYLLMAFD